MKWSIMYILPLKYLSFHGIKKATVWESMFDVVCETDSMTDVDSRYFVHFPTYTCKMLLYSFFANFEWSVKYERDKRVIEVHILNQQRN